MQPARRSAIATTDAENSLRGFGIADLEVTIAERSPRRRRSASHLRQRVNRFVEHRTKLDEERSQEGVGRRHSHSPILDPSGESV